jgi:hypothetical protein
MLGYIYAIIACYIGVLFEYVLILRNEDSFAVVVCAFVMLNFLVIIGFLFDDRKYYRTFKLHSITLWNTDFRS